jgi:hypothetical protein
MEATHSQLAIPASLRVFGRSAFLYLRLGKNTKHTTIVSQTSMRGQPS